ncbi:MAG TPA: efflux RND transporter periplasmic adaptor subunit [Bryobacteraceae bacterium]|nr:efflux RND transporter periplasmic adaptor subunit [Bryobacteraceae bacterium]
MFRLLAVGLVVTAPIVFTGCNANGKATQAAGPGGGHGSDGMAVPVTVARVVQKDVPIQIQVIGNVEAYSTISVKAQVGGALNQVHFQEGDFVKKDDLLFSIDPRPYQGQVNQAEATLARGRAQLLQAEANLAKDIAQQKYASAQAARYTKLFDEGVMSKEQADQMVSNADALTQSVGADRAAIESAKADINAAQAALETAKVMLGYTSIRSPIDGRTGNLTVKQGNLVAANTVELVTINQVQPIYVTFAVPESFLRQIKQYMADRKLPVTASAQDDSISPETGVLTFVDNTVDPSTGTIKLKGTFQNEGRRLWPGEFLRVTLQLTTQRDAMIIPNQALQTGQDGTFVYVVTQDQKAEFRPVVAGSRVKQELVIEKGLQVGETVITDGQLRLAPGSRVQLKEPMGGGGPPSPGSDGAGGTHRDGQPPAH